MAIVIPSKNIYEIENPKIRNNVVDNVSVEQTVVSPNNDYETAVYNESFEIDSTYNYFNSVIIGAQGSPISANGITQIQSAISFLSADSKYTTIKNLKIPLIKDNNYIKDLILGKNSNDEPNIWFSVKGIINTGTAVGTLVRTGLGNYDVGVKGTLTKTKTDTRMGVFNYPQLTISNPVTFSENNVSISAEAKLEIENETGLGNITFDKVSIEVDEYGKEYYSLGSANILCSIDTVKLGATGIYKTSNGAQEYTGVGTYEEYIPQQIEITVYGNTIGISLTDGTVTYGGGNRPFKIGGNELLQDSATTNDVLTTQYLADHIITEYKNGKETATLLCSIDEYYDEDGEKMISTKDTINNKIKMTFELQDEVIPMIRNAYGVDSPMSFYPNGLQKTFSVIGKEPIYDGALWQKLYLEEVRSVTNYNLKYRYSLEHNYYTVVDLADSTIRDVVIPEYISNIPVKIIGANAFDFSAITSIVIPKTIEKIEKSAIRGCSLLREIVINANLSDFSKPNGFVFASAGNLTNNTEVFFGKNVSRIPANLFNSNNGSNYPRINEVLFENNSVCQSIGKYAFYGCAKLKTIILPKTLKSIEKGAFYDCGALTKILSECTTMEEFNAIDIAEDNEPLNNTSVYLYSETEPSSLGYWRYNQNGEPVIWFESSELSSTEGIVFADNSDGTCSVTGYTGTATDVVIRKFWEGKLVTNISGDAFNSIQNIHSKNIHSIKIPESVTTIGLRAFSLCSNLNNVDFGENPSLTTIGNASFIKCTSLKSVIIPDSVTTVGQQAYDGCTNVENITIGKNLKNIGVKAFSDLNNLKSITFNAIELSHNTLDYTLFSDFGTTTEVTLTIGKDVKSIPNYLFYNASRIFTLIFENQSNCDTIGVSAFQNCVNLKSIDLIDSLTSISISHRAFYGCNSLKTLSNFMDYVSSLDTDCFANSAIEEISIGDLLVSIYSDAFSRCTSLSLVKIGKNVTDIHQDAFSGCTKLYTLYVPKSVSYISSYAFPTSVKFVYYEGTREEWDKLIATDGHSLSRAQVSFNQNM